MDAITLTPAALLAAVSEYIADSKAGDTLSYRETAMLDTETAAKSSANVLWGKLAAACAPVDAMNTEEALEFACTEDLAAGQIVRLEDGKIVPVKTQPDFFG